MGVNLGIVNSSVVSGTTLLLGKNEFKSRIQKWNKTIIKIFKNIIIFHGYYFILFINTFMVL